MRGKQARIAPCVASARITPAHAGKTEKAADFIPCVADHPRACGENTAGRTRPSSIFGSPPRMRGKLTVSELCHCVLRITPAHAGKTQFNQLCRSRLSDHPRACGENYLFHLAQAAKAGSPPRMRGKPAQQKQIVQWGRITPAHAGKTGDINAFEQDVTDHPRACGENHYTPGGWN